MGGAGSGFGSLIMSLSPFDLVLLHHGHEVPLIPLSKVASSIKMFLVTCGLSLDNRESLWAISQCLFRLPVSAPLMNLRSLGINSQAGSIAQLYSMPSRCRPWVPCSVWHRN